MRSILIIIFIVCNSIFAQKTKTYRISTVNWAGWSFLNVAKEKGIWDELGVSVDVKHFQNGALMHDAMLIGDIDFSMNMLPYMYWMNTHVQPVSMLLETNWSTGGDMFIINPKISLNDQQKKTVGIYVDGYALEFFAGQYLEKEGIDIKNFTFLYMKPDELVQQFIAGRLTAVVLFEPLTSMITSQNKGKVVATTADFPGVIREGLYTFKSRLVSFPKEDMINILRGIIRASRWLQNPANQKEFYSILNNHTFLNEDNFSDKELSEMLKSVKIHTLNDLKKENFANSTKYFSNLQTFLLKNKMTNKSTNPEELLALEYLSEAVKREEKFSNEKKVK